MSTPKHTPLRHRMLREIDDGHFSVHYGLHVNLVRGETWLTGPEKRTALDLLPYVERVRGGAYVGAKPARLTDPGRSLLAEWDAAHPESKEEESHD